MARHSLFALGAFMLLIGCTKKGVSAAPKQISGTIHLSSDLKNSVAATDTLFIIARKETAGPPLAVQKLSPLPTFPFAYTLTAQNVMFQGMPFEGAVEILVRVDKDGDAMTKVAGDLLGQHRGLINVGTAGADVVIDKVLP